MESVSIWWRANHDREEPLSLPRNAKVTSTPAMSHFTFV
jgi:hypothetical protein